VKSDGVGGVAVRAVSRGARGPVWTHCAPLVGGYGCTWSCWLLADPTKESRPTVTIRYASHQAPCLGIATGRHVRGEGR
jgi:hypothetical protein